MLNFCLDFSVFFVDVAADAAFLGAIGTFGEAEVVGVVGVGSIGDSVPENAFSMIAFMIASSGLVSLILVAVAFVFVFVFVFFAVSAAAADSSCFNFWVM